MKILLFSSILLSIMFMFLSHPISMMLIIIAQTFIVSLTLWSLVSMGWFSYIMFLIYLGGLMVLFIYISSLAYNEKFKINLKEIIPQYILASMTLLYLMISTEEMVKKNIKLDVTELIFKIYSTSSIFITSMTIIYLIITLIVVVKMTSQFEGPLRSKN